MATAAVPRSRTTVPENIIKQGYLKKNVGSNHLIPSASKQIALNIKQKFESKHWFVFGVRNGCPYMENYEKEESVFTGRPITSWGLSTYKNLSYTLGRTNTNYTFCIFLADSTIDLTASNRNQMLDWCRCIERNMRNLGLRSRGGKEDHTYSAFPVKKKPRPRAPDPPEENIYEDPPEKKNGDKDENHNRKSPELPPRLPKRNLGKDEDVFASLYSVQQRSTLARDSDYHNFSAVDETDEKPPPGMIKPDSDSGSDYDDADIIRMDNSIYHLGDDMKIYSLDEDSGAESEDNDQDENANENNPDDEVDDRCTSLPIISSKPLESDTSEDSDFISASFWMRNRKTEDLMLFDEDTNPAKAKQKLPPLPIEVLVDGPPVPLRTDSNRRAQSMRTRNCVSLDVRSLKPSRSRSPTIELLGTAPKPGQIAEGLLIDIDDSNRHSALDKLTESDRNEKTGEKSKLQQNKLKQSVKEEYRYKLPSRSVPKLVNGERTKKDDETNVSGKIVFEDGNEYETLDCRKSSNLEVKHKADHVNSVYETSWEARTGDTTVNGKDEKKDQPSKLKPKSEKGEETKSVTKKQSKPNKMLSVLSRKSGKSDKELPEALVVNLPQRSSKRSSTKCDPEADMESSSSDEGDLNDDGNLYSDFPEKVESKKTSGLKDDQFDSDILKLSRLNGPKTDPDISPELPVRKIVPNFSSGQQSQPLVHSNSSKPNHCDPNKELSKSEIQNHFANNLSKSVNENWKPGVPDKTPPLPPPVAPPRRNKKTVSGVDVQYLSESGKHKTVISGSTSSKSPPLPRKQVPLELPPRNYEQSDPPLPPRGDSSPSKGKFFCDPNRPALPPPRNALSKGASFDTEDLRPETLKVGRARPKSMFLTNRQQSTTTGAVSVMNLKQNQVDILRAEIESSGGMVRQVPKVHFQSGLAFVELLGSIWIAGWDVKKFPRLYDKFHIGDQILSINDVAVDDLGFAQKLVKNVKADTIEVTVRRVPYAKVYAIQRSAEGESLGMKREGGTAEIVYVDPHGLACKHGLTNKAVCLDGEGLCSWSLTEINMRPLNLFFKDKEIEHRLSAVGRDISIVVQPTDFIRELKKQLKKMRNYKDYLVQ